MKQRRRWGTRFGWRGEGGQSWVLRFAQDDKPGGVVGFVLFASCFGGEGGWVAGAGFAGFYVAGEAAQEGGRLFGGDGEVEPVVR
jgi:hypothetical protein